MKRSPRILALFVAFAMLVPALADARGLRLIRDAEIERTLRLMAAPLLQVAGLPQSTVNIYIIQDNSLNAFVAGGRNIFLNTGLLMEFESPEELLGVIAHEIGHLSGGHQARRAIDLRNAKGPALLGLLVGIAVGAAGGGEAGAAVAAGTQAAVIRQFLANTRAQEASADQAALTFLTRAGIDPSGLLRVIEVFRGQEVLSIGSVDPYILTHPLSTNRMTLIERRVREAAGRKWKKDELRDYWHSRMRAKLEGFLRNPTRTLDGLEDQPDTEMNLLRKAVAYHRDRRTELALHSVGTMSDVCSLRTPVFPPA